MDRGRPLARQKIDNLGIIIANTGSPAAPTSEAVADYLRRFLSDPRICPTNPHLWGFILERFIIPKRAPASAKKYASIWTEAGSPLDVHMRALAQGLQTACAASHPGALVRHAMAYGMPSVEDAIADCQGHGCEEVVIVPLYPQNAFSTTGAIKDKVDQALDRLQQPVAVRFVESYSDEPAYIAAIADSIASEGFDVREGDRLLFAFHSIPMADVRAGDSYGDQTRRTARSVAAALGLGEGAWQLGYQCRFDKSRAWLGPTTKEALDELADARRLFVVAPNFAVDCLETLYDIEVQLREAWLEAGSDRSAESFRYIPCLNASTAQVALLQGVIEHNRQRA